VHVVGGLGTGLANLIAFVYFITGVVVLAYNALACPGDDP